MTEPRRRRAIVVPRWICRTMVLWLWVSPSLSAQSAPGNLSGRDLYQAACAACHATDGRGMPQTSRGFDVPVPDFTDCSFATPEANADWLAVTHEGGPIRAFDRKMPAFGDALSDEQIGRILEHIRSFCQDPAWPRGELNLPRPLVTEKAFPENEAVLTTSVAASGRGEVGNEVLYERRIGSRTQLEVAVPLAWREGGSGSWSQGLGDIAAAVKRVLVHSLDRGSILSVAGEVVFPTGKETAGLGTGAALLEPFVTYGQILPRDSFLQLQSGLEISTHEARAGHEAFWRAAVGRTFIEAPFGRAWSPMIEVLGARELEAGAPVHWDLVPQVQVTLSRRQHVRVSGGVRLPVGNRDERGVSILTYVLWDWFDGGLFSGWR